MTHAHSAVFIALKPNSHTNMKIYAHIHKYNIYNLSHSFRARAMPNHYKKSACHSGFAG